MKVNLLLVGVSMLCSAAVFGQSNSPSPAVVVPEGTQAVTISRGAVTNAVTGIKAGDRVNILVTYRVSRTNDEKVTQMIMQEVLVLAVARGKADPSRKETGESSITLAVKPEQVKLVGAADGAAALSVALCPPNDGKAPYEETSSPLPEGPGDFFSPGDKKWLQRRESE